MLDVPESFIDVATIKDSGTSSTIELGIKNHWAFFKRIQGRRTTKNSMDEFFSGDQGFDFMQVSNE